MTALATLEDLNVRLAVPLTEDKYERALALLDDASASVRGYTGQQFTAGTSTNQILRPKNGIVVLPQRPVNAITSVKDSNGNDVTYTWPGLDRVTMGDSLLNAWEVEPYRYGITNITVTYTHGYSTIPDDIVAVVCQIAARALGRAPEEGGITQESIAGYSYSIGTIGATGAFGMLEGERAVLDRYRQPLIGAFRVAL